MADVQRTFSLRACGPAELPTEVPDRTLFCSTLSRVTITASVIKNEVDDFKLGVQTFGNAKRKKA